MKRLASILIPTLMLTVAPAAHAVEYKTVQADKSRLSFGYRQMGVAMDGRFSRFTVQLAFDPARPAAARAVMEVELASIDAGSAEANDEVAGKEWFNSKAFPVARFVADAVKPLGGNRYEVHGKLTIKGHTQAVVAPATLTPQAGAAAFDGAFQIKRADFAIGEGAWADFGTVANEISIKFHILASAGK
ncbi:MAG: YceI family protein [Rhodocyclaceae bacterium]|nr:YceI family protein [Rhodocyclaceae bacterium]